MGGQLVYSRSDALPILQIKMNTHGLTATIAIMGAITVALSLTVAYRFYLHQRYLGKDGKKLTKALLWNLIGEATIGAITLIFALLAWSEKLPFVPIEVQSALRFIAFAATSITTVHLWKVIEELRQ